MEQLAQTQNRRLHQALLSEQASVVNKFGAFMTKALAELNKVREAAQQNDEAKK